MTTTATIGLFVSPPWSGVIERATTGRAHLRAFTAARDLAAALRTARIDVVLLDPARLDGRDTIELLRSALRHNGSPCVFCTTLSGESLRAAVAAAGLEPTTVLTTDEDPDGSRIGSILDDLGSERAGRELWELFAFHSIDLPHHVEQVVRDMVRAPEHHFDAEDLARAAGMSRRHLDRVLRGVGICSARRLVVAVRVAHAVDRIAHQRRSVTATSESLGYASRVVLSRHIKGVIGRVPTDLGEGLESQEIRDALRRFVTTLDVIEAGVSADHDELSIDDDPPFTAARST